MNKISFCLAASTIFVVDSTIIASVSANRRNVNIIFMMFESNLEEVDFMFVPKSEFEKFSQISPRSKPVCAISSYLTNFTMSNEKLMIFHLSLTLGWK